MSKSVFLNDMPAEVARVYSQQVVETLCKEADLDSAVYSREFVISNPEKFADTEYVFSTWGMPVFSEKEVQCIFPSLKAVFYAAGTVQSFAHPFLKCGVKIFSAWAANAVPVAEYTVAQILLANKAFYRSSIIHNQSSYYEQRNTFLQYRGNYGAKVGIIGAGMIGKLIIEMLKPYRLEVLVFDPFLPDEKAAELGVEKCSLQRIFSECDVVSNHLANNQQTQGMLNGELFRRMPENATFLNTGRGAQVVEQDLIDVLTSRPDITAVLDVTEPEPPVEGSPLYTLENCVLTPHIAGSSGEEVHRMAEYMLGEYKKHTNGEPTQHEVTLKMLETMA